MSSAAAMQSALDRLAIGLSALCAVHCLLTPVILVAFPVLAATLGSDDAFHRQLATVVLPSSALALVLGCRRHRDRLVLALGALGLAAFLLVALVGHALLGEAGERALTIGSSLIVAAAHARNQRICRSNDCPC